MLISDSRSAPNATKLPTSFSALQRGSRDPRVALLALAVPFGGRVELGLFAPILG